jgi:hypothetical protein
MARIFQKYVTEEGRSETPPEIIEPILAKVSAGHREGDKAKSNTKNAFGSSDMMDNGKRDMDDDKDEDDDDDMTSMMKGMRNMMSMMKVMSQMGKMNG